MRSEVKKAFNPEFLNRLDEVILFTSLTDDDLIKIMDLLVDQVNVNLVAKQVKIRLTPRGVEVHSREDLRRPQLRRPSAAPRLAEVHRRSALGGADPGLAAASFGARSLPRRYRHLLPRAGSGGRAPKPSAEAVPAAVAAEPAPGTLLYTF